MRTITILLFTISLSAQADERVIAKADLTDKIAGFWNGQLLGNYIGFPFENKYIDAPIPVLIDHVYTADYNGQPTLNINHKDRRGHIPVLAVAETAIRENGGRMEMRNGQVVYVIASDLP